MVNEDALVREDNEVYCNFQSPIGKLIQHLDTLSKKPKIDEKLNGAIDSFSQALSQQDNFLRNGIVKINFAEAGLFFQSCSVLFGKSVDLLWDQALELHARLIKYDYENAIQKGKKINKDVIEKLEERKNKYKRKKNFQLIVPEKKNNDDILLFDKSIETSNTEDDEDSHFESINISSAWNYVKHCYEEIAKIPRAVFDQQRKMYRIDNYDILDGADADIYDLDDGEFNTKYSRMPAWHHIDHLFEYNREGLLPDKNNLIARLRLAVYEEIWFLRDNNIPLNTPFKEYEEHYKVFKQQFFEKEALKWQNMPLDTLADLRRQMEYLAQHGCDEIADSSLAQDDCAHSSSGGTVNLIFNQDIPLQNGSVDATDSSLDQNITAQNNGKTGDLNQGICAQTEGAETSDASSHRDIPAVTSDNSQITLEGTCSQAGLERTLSNNSSSELLGESLTINIEKLPALVVSRKLRPDSGFCDVKSETRSLFDPVDSVSPPDNSLMDSGFLSSTSLDTSANLSNGNQTGLDHTHDENQLHPTDNHEIEQLTSNQSLIRSSTTLESGGDSLMTSRNITIIEKMTLLKCGRTLLKQKLQLINDINKESGPPNKRRKLSKKQLEKLINSLVPTVGEEKFEQFFAMNYQPDVGEGEIDANQSCTSDARISDSGSLETLQDNRQESLVEKNITEITTSGVNTSDISSPLTGEIGMITSNENSAPNDVEQAPDEVRGNEDANYTESEAADQDNRQEPVLENNLPRINMQEANRSDNSLSNTDQHSPTNEDELFQQLLTSLRESRDGDSNISEAIAQEKLKRMEQEKEASRKRVEEWRTLIAPILSNLKEKDFDIHEYGSKIMENMEINEKRFFKHIVCGKPSVEVVRYFISSLQLANTGNIEIYGAIEGKQSNETFGITLLKTDRYHEHLTNYNAPSEQTFRECIEQLRRNQSKSKHEIFNNDSQNERMKNGPKSKKAKLSPRRSETKVQQQLANRKEHGVTLRWVGTTNIRDPLPKTSYADHHSDNVQASLPLPSDLTMGRSCLPNSSCAFLDTPKLQKTATMKILSKNNQNLLDLHSRKNYQNFAKRVNINGRCLQSTAPSSSDLVYGHKNSLDCDKKSDSNHPHAEVQYSEASGTFNNNMFDDSQLDGCSDDDRVETGVINIDNTNSSTTNFKDYSSSLHIDFRAARELSPAPPSEIIFLNNLESVQRTRLGYPMFSSPK